MIRAKKGVYYREGDHQHTHCYWEIHSMENEEKTIKIYYLQYIEGDEKFTNEYQVFDSEDFKEIQEELRRLRLIYPKVIKLL